jgi:hypothetical protein
LLGKFRFNPSHLNTLRHLVVLRAQTTKSWPGSSPSIVNKVVRPNPGASRSPPLNQNDAMLINVVVGYLFYLLPVFIPHSIWVGLAPVLFGFLQFGTASRSTPS